MDGLPLEIECQVTLNLYRTVTMGGIKFSFVAPLFSATPNTGSTVCTTRVTKIITITARTVQFIQVSMPMDVPTNKVLIKQETSNVPKHLLVPRTLTTVIGGRAFIQVMNINSQQTTLYKGSKVGTYTPVHSLMFVDTSPAADQMKNAHMPDIDLSSTSLTPNETQQLQKLLHDYADLLVTAGESLGCTGLLKHKIQISGPPIRQSMRRLPVALKDTVDSQVKTMLQPNIIQSSCSPWSSPVEKKMVIGDFVLIFENSIQ